MSEVGRIYVRGPFTVDELVARLERHLGAPFSFSRDRDGTGFYAGVYDRHPCDIGPHGPEELCPDGAERCHVTVFFWNLRFSTREARDAWLRSTWETWASWLRQSGATEILMTRNFDVRVEHWVVPDGYGAC